MNISKDSGIQSGFEQVYQQSAHIPKSQPIVKGYDFDQGVNYDKLLQSFATMGLQATQFSLAVEMMNQAIKWRLSDEPKPKDGSIDQQVLDKNLNIRSKIFLGYTSNMISTGNREIIKYLAKHRMVDVIVTTGGGIEEDIIKCLAPFYMGDFHLKGDKLRKDGHNRIANMIVPNSNYCSFEDWLVPIFDQLLKEQNETQINWTPSKLIHRLGQEINNEESVYYWCWKNKIQVYCPGITDGAIGDMYFFHSYKNPGLRLDVAEDIRLMNDEALKCKPRKVGALILGGGLPKHHIFNANISRGGVDWCVLINSGVEYDGSDSGAPPDEAVSWGKVKLDAKPIKVWGDATILFPLLVAQTFAANK